MVRPGDLGHVFQTLYTGVCLSREIELWQALQGLFDEPLPDALISRKFYRYPPFHHSAALIVFVLLLNKSAEGRQSAHVRELLYCRPAKSPVSGGKLCFCYPSCSHRHEMKAGFLPLKNSHFWTIFHFRTTYPFYENNFLPFSFELAMVNHNFNFDWSIIMSLMFLTRKNTTKSNQNDSRIERP